MNYEQYQLDFVPMRGDGIRLFGQPGAKQFISVGELEVYGRTPEVDNLPPVADAGQNASVAALCTVTLDGSGSRDLDNGVLSYRWSQTAGTAVTLANATSERPTFTAPNSAGTLTFKLTVSDETTPSFPAVVAITVNSSGTGTNLAAAGTPVAFVTEPKGGGNRNLQIMRDGLKEPVNSTSDAAQYDTWNGIGNRTLDWVGYVFSKAYMFDRVVFQEGKQFGPSGCFATLTVEVRQNGQWNPVTGLNTAPAYACNGVNYETYTLTFTGSIGDGVRISGRPNNDEFISVGELEVYGVASTNQAPSVNAGADQTVAASAKVTLDGSGTDPEGAPLTYAWTQTAGAAVTLTAANAAATSFTAPTTSATLTFSLQASDGVTTSPADTVTVTVVGAAGSTNMAGQGTPTAFIMAPTGGGNHDIQVIRDGVKPAVSSAVDSTQYDTYNGVGNRAVDWIGYTFPTARTFDRVVFQEGKQFGDGGCFASLTVQVRQDGKWNNVVGLTTAPAYACNGANYDTYTLAFTGATGDGIRIYGEPKGKGFISVGELEVYGSATTNQAPTANAGAAQTVNAATSVTLNGGLSSDPENAALSYVWTQTQGTAITLAGAATVTPTFTAPPLAGTLTFSLVVTDGVNASAPATVVITVNATITDLTGLGTPTALITAPIGGGNPNILIIKDSVKEPVGSLDDTKQYDTYTGVGNRTSDWIGYTFKAAHTFNRVVFQEGKQFGDSGCFANLTVQVRQGVDNWVSVAGLAIEPAYSCNGVNFETYTLTFADSTGDGIRIFGEPNTQAFISVGELTVYGK